MSTTEVLDRYLQAVGFWLPRKQRQDILSELSEDIHSQIEEKEAELGRKLNMAEMEFLLKQRGRPVVVANHYLPQEYLIGPLLFPIYRFVLMIVALCYLVPWVLVAIGLIGYSPTYRAQHFQAGWFKGVLSVWSRIWLTAFIALGVVTIVFAVLERVNARSHFIEEDWDPRKLPAVRNRNQIPRIASSIELAANLAFSIWWIPYMYSRVVLDRPDVRIILTPLWPYFFWGFLLVALLNLGLASANLARPYWTRIRAGLRLLSNVAGSALFCWLLKVHMLTEITVANVSATRTAAITSQINLWAGRAFPLALALGVATLLHDAYRIFRAKTKTDGVAQQAAAMLS